MKNKFENTEFIYVGNLAKRIQIKEDLENNNKIRDKFSIKISGRVFHNGINTILIKPGSQTNKQGMYQARIDLEKNPMRLRLRAKSICQCQNPWRCTLGS